MDGNENSLVTEWTAHIEDLLALAADFSGHEIRSPDTPHDKEVAKVVAFKFVQVTRSTKSVLLLCRNGDASNAFVLMRAIYENLVDVAYLVKNPTDVWRYLEESADLENKLTSAGLIHAQPMHAAIGGRRPSADRLRERYSALAHQHSSCKSWKRLGVRTKAEKCGFSDILGYYDIIYPVASGYIHGSSTIMLDYLRSIRSEELEFRVDYSEHERETEPALGISAMLLLRFVAFLDALFEFGLRENVEGLNASQIMLLELAQSRLLQRYTSPGGSRPEG